MVRKIYLVGLGPGDPESMTLRTLQFLKKSRHIYVRTARHPGLAILDRYGIPYRTLDYFYKGAATFEETYQKIAYYVLNAAIRYGKAVYCVPGSPFFAEKTVELILQKAPLAGISCTAFPAVSFIDAVQAELGLPGGEEMAVLDALREDRLLDYPERHICIIQAYNHQIASRVKLKLAELYPDEHPVIALRGAGLPAGKTMKKIRLYEMDRIPFIDHLTTFYLPPLNAYGIQDLLRVMRRLRGKEGCPWDREQDHHSLKPYLLEEAYEVLGAITKGDAAELCEELGDMLLQVVFHCQVAAEKGDFHFHDIVGGITEKLVRRHPHVFGNAKAKTAGDVTRSWQQLKKDEKNGRESLFVLETYLPALLRAQKLQRHASTVGFDWPDASGAWDKLEEELKELQDAYKTGEEVKIEEELGDLLFAAVNVARFLNVDAEQALAASTEKFFRRLRYVEERARDEGGEISGYSMSKLDEWWEEAKKRLNG